MDDRLPKAKFTDSQVYRLAKFTDSQASQSLFSSDKNTPTKAINE
jgi:hypothetical protein